MCFQAEWRNLTALRASSVGRVFWKGVTMRKFLFLMAISCFAVSVGVSQDQVTVPRAIVAYPDMVLYNGKIMTMDDISPSTSPGSVVEAIALRDKKIMALGTDSEMLSYAGPETKKMDLKGRTVVPGVVDPHTHIHNNYMSAWLEENPQAIESMGRTFSVGGSTVEDLKRGIELVLRERMGDAPEGQWAFINLPTNDPDNPGSGTGIGVKFLQQKEMTLQELDLLAPNHPVFVRSHPASIINSAAKREIQKIYGQMPPLETADEQGFGELTDYNRSLVVDGYFRLHPEELAAVVEEGLHKYSAVGVTSYVSHIMGLQFLNVFQTLVREDRMPIRFGFTHYFGFQSNEDPSAFYMRLGDMAGLGTDYFWSAGVGLGNIDSGPPMICSSMEGPAELKEREWCRNAPGSAFAKGVLSAILARGRIATGHAYGDKGVDYLMDSVEEAMEIDPTITLEYVRSRRFSSDHCGFYPRPDQMPRMANLGWWISCGGNVLSRSYPWLEQYGMQYAKWISPVKSLIENGINVVYEMEAGVGVQSNTSEPYWAQGYALISRKNEYGAMVTPEEAIDRVTLMKMSTAWPAKYALREKDLGTLEAGKMGDLLVLNKDYFTIPVNEIPEVFPVMTMVGGNILVLRSEYADEIGVSPIGPQLIFRERNRYTGSGD